MRKIWQQGSKPGVFPRLLEQNPNLITQISRACHRFYLPCSTNPSGRIILTPPTAQHGYPGRSRYDKWRNAFFRGYSVLWSALSSGIVGINSTLQPASLLAWIFAPMSGIFIAMLQLYLVYFCLYPLPRLHICGVSANLNYVLGENGCPYLHLPPVLAWS